MRLVQCGGEEDGRTVVFDGYLSDDETDQGGVGRRIRNKRVDRGDQRVGK